MMTSEYSQPHQPCVLTNTTANRTSPSLEFNEHHQVRERCGNSINTTSGVRELGTPGDLTTTTMLLNNNDRSRRLCDNHHHHEDAMIMTTRQLPSIHPPQLIAHTRPRCCCTSTTASFAPVDATPPPLPMQWQPPQPSSPPQHGCRSPTTAHLPFLSLPLIQLHIQSCRDGCLPRLAVDAVSPPSFTVVDVALCHPPLLLTWLWGPATGPLLIQFTAIRQHREPWIGRSRGVGDWWHHQYPSHLLYCHWRGPLPPSSLAQLAAPPPSLSTHVVDMINTQPAQGLPWPPLRLTGSTLPHVHLMMAPHFPTSIVPSFLLRLVTLPSLRPSIWVGATLYCVPYG